MVGPIQWQLLRDYNEEDSSRCTLRAAAATAIAAAAAAFRGCYLGPPVGGALIFKLLKMLQAHTHTQAEHT